MKINNYNINKKNEHETRKVKRINVVAGKENKIKKEAEFERKNISKLEYSSNANEPHVNVVRKK